VLASIIITTRNEEPALLEATLSGIRETTPDGAVEIIVVDDGSDAPVAPGSLGAARLLRHPTPLGVCESRRSGALLARGELLIWLDAHMSFGAHWLQQLAVQAHPDALVCSPFWTYDLKDCMCWGADLTWNSERDYYAGKYPGFGLRHRVERPPDAAPDVPMVIGACYAMHREAYERLGGFSPHFRIWGIDEQDISARTWLCGMRVLCATHAQVGHFSRAAFPYAVQYEHLEFNQLAMLRTVFEKSTIERLEPQFAPIPDTVSSWLASTDLAPWRKSVQRRRKLTDAEFFKRFLPELSEPATPPKRRGGKGRSA
jgi:GT2 family glycosyltransferase